MSKRKLVNPKRWPGVYVRESTERILHGKPDVCYEITFKAGKKKRWEKIGWKSEGYSPQIAAEIRAKRIRDTRHGKEVLTNREIRLQKQKTNRTIGEVKDAYFNSERGLNLKGRSIDINRFENYLAFLATRPASSLTEMDVAKIKRRMHDRNLAPQTVANALELLRRIIRYGAKNKLCPDLSFTIELPVVNNEKIEYLTDEEATRLMQVLNSWPDRDVARMLKIAWFTGMRRGEIFKLRDQDVDFNQKLIFLYEAKSGKSETIPMSGAVEEILKEQMRDRAFPESGYIFPGRFGGRRTGSSAAAKIKKAANLPRNFRIFHGLRHHLATSLASSGEYTLDMIGKLLTHKSHRMTMRYAKFLPDAQKKAADRAAEILQGQIAQKDNIHYDFKKN